MPDVFAVPVFFIVFRETLETSIVVSILLAFLKQSLSPAQDSLVHKKLVRQIWLGVIVGLLICICIGAGFIGAFYKLGRNHWQSTENIWEGVFGLVASLIISLMGAALLRVSKLQDKWRAKIGKALEKKDQRSDRGTVGSRFKLWLEKYALFILPFVTVLREGIEAVVFIGGVSLGFPASAFPLPVILGLLAGSSIGYLIYKGGHLASIQIFLIISTCFLYLVAAGLFSKAVWFLEANQWAAVIGGDSNDLGSGAGSYDIRKSVWHVNCCNPEVGGGSGWGVFNSLFGWQNSATYGSVISYNLYWLAVIVAFGLMRNSEQKGHLPFMKAKATNVDNITTRSSSDAETSSKGSNIEKQGGNEIRQVES